MMPPDAAARIFSIRAITLFRKIEEKERDTGLLACGWRSELGAIRAALFSFGWPHESLPEVPYLDCDVLQRHLDAKEAKKAARNREQEVVNG